MLMTMMMRAVHLQPTDIGISSNRFIVHLLLHALSLSPIIVYGRFW
jgi:hypothetical protein